MKKKILIVLLVLVSVAGSAFSNIPAGMNEQVAASFKKEFTLAEDVKWETTKDLVKITFKLNEQVMFAYYTESGELMAVVRNISSIQLPIQLLAELKRDYNAWWITDLFEMAGTTGTSYYISLENADNTLVLKASGVNGWQTYKKVKKSTE